MNLPEIGSPEPRASPDRSPSPDRRMLEKRNMQAAEVEEPMQRGALEGHAVPGPYGSLLPSAADMKAEIDAWREQSTGGLKSTEEYAEYAAALRSSRHAYDAGERLT